MARDYNIWISEATDTLARLKTQLENTPRKGRKYIKERIAYETFSIEYAKKEQAKQT